jgi:hypothetical protein
VKIYRKLLPLALLGLTIPAAFAHHSLAAEFDSTKPVTLTGTVVSLDWRNPHAWLYVDVKGPDGVVTKWQCELGSPNAMTRAGFNSESLKPGDQVVLDGLLAKDASKTMNTRVVKDKEGKVLLSQQAQR